MPYDTARAERVAELTRQGVSGSAIADILGVTRRTVVRDRRRTGTSLPAHPRIPQEKIDRAVEMLKDGCAYIEVERTLGISFSNLRKRFPGYGMKSGWDWAHQLAGVGKYREEAN